MSMITPPPTESRIVTTAKEAGAGAAVTVIAVVAIYMVAQLAIAAVITIAAVLAIGAVLWFVFRRSR